MGGLVHVKQCRLEGAFADGGLPETRRLKPQQQEHKTRLRGLGDFQFAARPKYADAPRLDFSSAGPVVFAEHAQVAP
jgi:hypothetical protein